MTLFEERRLLVVYLSKIAQTNADQSKALVRADVNAVSQR
jgi:hypothetical protein